MQLLWALLLLHKDVAGAAMGSQDGDEDAASCIVPHTKQDLAPALMVGGVRSRDRKLAQILFNP